MKNERGLFSRPRSSIIYKLILYPNIIERWIDKRGNNESLY
ncbi:MAG: hypothetical protein ACI8YC_001296, partial [Salibacteraceae bacterium]